jgi:hypothetical protein
MKMPNSALHNALVILLLVAPRATLAQTTALPPERFSYQGFVTDGTGTALATNAPHNYDIIFRIWNDASATAVVNRLWTEEQTVTVDKGYFSVVLGEGGAYAGEPRTNLSGLFSAADASDRYVELTVRGIGTGGSDVLILPRLRLLPSPYAFLARSASKLVSSTGADLVTSSGGGIAVNGSIVASALSGAISGTNLAAGSVGSAQLAPNSVTSAAIAPGAVVTNDIAAGAVGTAQIAANAVTSAQIAANAVGTAQIAASAVTTTQIANNTIIGADIATNYALWDKTATNISYSAGDVSVGVTSTPKNLTVTSNLTVAGSLTIGTGGTPVTYHPPLIVEAKTPNDQTLWDIHDIDVTAFAANPGGFTIRIFMQHETQFAVRNLTGTIVFEQPGYALNNTNYPNTFIRGSFSGTGGYGITSFTLGNPAVGGGPFDTLVTDSSGWLNVYDFNPANLNGGVNSKPVAPIFHIWVAFNPSVSGRVVVSDN